MGSAESPGSSRVETKVQNNRSMEIEISDSGNLLGSSGSKIKTRSEVKTGGTETRSEIGGTTVIEEIEKGASTVTGNQGSQGKSWVAVAQEKKVLKKYDLEIMEKEGQKEVEIPDEVIEKVNHLWEDYLIGKFLDTAPHVGRIHATVNRIWNQGDKKVLIDVHVIDETTMKFKVMDPGMRARILKRGMWSIGNIPMVITKWIPDEMKEKPEITAIPLWVHLKNVPMNMYSWQGLSFIASAAGFPVRLHPETAACSNFKVAKIFINADLTKELPTKINFKKNGVSSLVEFIYPWLPMRCSTCKKWGHTDKVCIKNKEGGKSEEEISKEGDDMSEGEMMKKTEISAQMKDIELAEPENGIEKGELVNNWEDVTPKKGNRSPILQFGQVKILTPSRFSALQEVNEEGELGNQVEYEEVLSVVEEIITEENAVEKVGNDDEKEVEGEENMEENTNEIDGEKEVNSNDQAVKSIAGIEHWPDLATTTRPSLPRLSKTMHKVVPDKTMQRGVQGKHGKRNKNSPI